MKDLYVSTLALVIVIGLGISQSAQAFYTSDRKSVSSIDEMAPDGVAPFNMITSRYVNENSVSLEFEFRNYDFLPVNNFKYLFEGNDIRDTIEVDDISLGYQQTLTHALPEEISPGFGFLTCTVTVIEINGEVHDGGEDAYSEEILVYDESNTTARSPLVETFTSSTCGPCRPGNQNLHNILDGLSESPVVLKWQQNFPSVGDPYCTEETIDRRNYYGINAIPNTNVDGSYFDDNTNAINSSDITGARDKGSLVDIQAQYEVNPAEQRIRVYGSFTASVGVLEGSHLMIAVKELRTDNNVKSNGETEFFDVVKKALPDVEGTELSRMEAGESYSFDMTYTFPGDYRLPQNGQPANRIDLETEHSVEEFTDLTASVWVEDREAEFVLGAVDADKATSVTDIAEVEKFVLSPNPVGETLQLSLELKDSKKIGIALYDISGRLIWQKDMGTQRAVHPLVPVSGLVSGQYFIEVRVGKQSFSEAFIKR